MPVPLLVFGRRAGVHTEVIDQRNVSIEVTDVFVILILIIIIIIMDIEHANLK